MSWCLICPAISSASPRRHESHCLRGSKCSAADSSVLGVSVCPALPLRSDANTYKACATPSPPVCSVEARLIQPSREYGGLLKSARTARFVAASGTRISLSNSSRNRPIKNSAKAVAKKAKQCLAFHLASERSMVVRISQDHFSINFPWPSATPCPVTTVSRASSGMGISSPFFSWSRKPRSHTSRLTMN